MKLTELKDQFFPDYDFNEWKKKAEESLKGKSLDSLQRSTYEGIILKPLYMNADKRAVSEFPGDEDFRRGTDSLGYLENKWKVAQRLSYTEPEELRGKLKRALESGQTALSFEVTEELAEKKNFLIDLIGTHYHEFPLVLDAGEFHAEVLSALEKISALPEERAKITGYVAADPLSTASIKGVIPDNFSEILEGFSKDIKNANEKLPGLRTILVNTAPYHNGGANAVQELGIAAAAGVFYIDSLSELDTDQTINNLIFNFSIGSNYFMEIAKIRAARVIWNKVVEAYGKKETSQGMQIAAETSSFTKTVYDPYVNLLRCGNEAFAAVVGGVQYLNVTPYDQLTGSSPFSERIARNTQLILQEEAYLTKVIDPAGGSWYIEELTNELAQKAWGFFQEIEAKGGFLEALRSNWLQEKIADVYNKRQEDIFTRKQSIIGTNVYANLDDADSDILTTVQSEDGQKTERNIEAIPQYRLAQPYEKLRQRAAALRKNSGAQPLVGCICLGSLKQHKARLDFVRGFLSAGGIQIVSSNPVQTAEEAVKFVTETNTNHFCICGTNDQYQTMGIEILQAVMAESPDRAVYLAGLPEKEDQVNWIENGLKQFIHVKSNCFETISSILSEMEASL